MIALGLAVGAALPAPCSHRPLGPFAVVEAPDDACRTGRDRLRLQVAVHRTAARFLPLSPARTPPQAAIDGWVRENGPALTRALADLGDSSEIDLRLTLPAEDRAIAAGGRAWLIRRADGMARLARAADCISEILAEVPGIERVEGGAQPAGRVWRVLTKRRESSEVLGRLANALHRARVAECAGGADCLVTGPWPPLTFAARQVPA